MFVSRSRFLPDQGLTVRMTATIAMLLALFVGVVVGLMFVIPPGAVPVLAAFALGLLFYQWWVSDKVALRAMGGYEVSPEQEPELHAMVDRLCLLADMQKPRVAVSDMPVANAFATGRSPDRSVVCVTRKLVGDLNDQELEGVLAHELAHVAHRDVLVMTMAAAGGVLIGTMFRLWLWGGGDSRKQNAPFVIIALVAGAVMWAVSFLLTRLLSRYRELAADRAAAHLTMNPGALASALQKISGSMAAIPGDDLREHASANAFAFAAALKPGSLQALGSTHPTLEARLTQLARVQTALGRRS